MDLTVDGRPTSMHVFGCTVADALAKAGITVGENTTSSSPAPTKRSGREGHRHALQAARSPLTVDGVSTGYWTTATTVDKAI
ncbi:MAG: ubiquitin-like domain-containing protein [Actinomycetales bacterium]|nr:ubiquitin-like domain-containing protein [Candidatus Phosphoribacter baldrii]